MIMRLDRLTVASGEIEEIAQKLRKAAGLPKEPTGEVAKK